MKAIALFSGGLDSILATKLIIDQGIEVKGIWFSSIFFGPDKGKWGKILKIVENFSNFSLEVVDISREFIEILKNPKYGFGKCANPCIDCRILMLKKAKEIMEREKASFVISGEVVGQRPFSQRRKIMKLIEEESSLKGLLLRPLCAKLLPLSIPEEKKWVDREKLLNISGRGRKEQIKLAEKLGIRNYLSPAGGCVLTDKQIGKRVKDLLLIKEDPDLNDFKIILHGRVFFFEDGTFFIVGRNKSENEILLKLRKEDDIVLKVKDKPSPIGILRGKNKEKFLNIALNLTFRYSDAKNDPFAFILCIRNNKLETFKVTK